MAERPVEEPGASAQTSSVTYYLFCLECPAVSNQFERGWRGFLTDDEFEPSEVAVLCPECAEREFGKPRLRLRLDDE